MKKSVLVQLLGLVLFVSGLALAQEAFVEGVGDPPPPPPQNCRLVTMECNANGKKVPFENQCCMHAGGNRAGTCSAARNAEEMGNADSLQDSKRCGKLVAYEDGVCQEEEIGPCAADRPKGGCITQECPANGNL